MIGNATVAVGRAVTCPFPTHTGVQPHVPHSAPLKHTRFRGKAQAVEVTGLVFGRPTMRSHSISAAESDCPAGRSSAASALLESLSEHIHLIPQFTAIPPIIEIKRELVAVHARFDGLVSPCNG